MSDNRTTRILRILEGYRGEAYVDASGHSIGYGHFITAEDKDLIGKRLSKEQAEDLLQKDIAKHAAAGLKNLKVPISENQKAALTSLAFNAGPGASQRVISLLNQGKTKEAADKFLQYNKSRDTANGPLHVNEELVARRDYERKLFLTKDNEAFDEKYRGKSGSTAVAASRSRTSISTYLQGLDMQRVAGLSDNERILAQFRDLNRRLGSQAGMMSVWNRS